MQTDLRAAVAPRRAPPAPLHQPPEPGAGLLETLGAIEDEDHILVIGKDGLERWRAASRRRVAGDPSLFA